MTTLNTDRFVTVDRDCRIMANPVISFREEPDRWGLLYNPEIDFTMGISPESAFLWKQLENKTTVKEIALKIKEHFIDVPGEIEKQVIEAVNHFVKIGFANVSQNDAPG